MGTKWSKYRETLLTSQERAEIELKVKMSAEGVLKLNDGKTQEYSKDILAERTVKKNDK